MAEPKILILPTARDNYRQAIRETEREWGRAQARKYRRQLKDGFLQIPQHYARIRKRAEDRAGKSGFRLHHIQHHYAAYFVIDENTFVVGAVLHERMDIPARLEHIEQITDLEYQDLMGRPRPRIK